MTAQTVDLEKLDPLLSQLDLRGLSYKVRRFIFLYTGDAAAAAQAAGYCANYKHRAHQRAALCRVVSRLMKNPKVHYNISLIQRELEKFGVMSTAEAKLIISELARHSENERVRMEACRLALQWSGQLSEKLLIEKQEKKDITIRLAAHMPCNDEEWQEYNRLQKAIAEQQTLERLALSGGPGETTNRDEDELCQII
jgi:hypothetical protein